VFEIERHDLPGVLREPVHRAVDVGEAAAAEAAPCIDFGVDIPPQDDGSPNVNRCTVLGLQNRSKWHGTCTTLYRPVAWWYAKLYVWCQLLLQRVVALGMASAAAGDTEPRRSTDWPR
jgi:hypothetical protein